MSPLEHMALRVTHDPHFFASQIHRYKELHLLSDADLCDLLGCTRETLTTLRLCRVPRGEKDVKCLVEKFAISAEALQIILAT